MDATERVPPLLKREFDPFFFCARYDIRTSDISATNSAMAPSSPTAFAPPPSNESTVISIVPSLW